MSEFQRCRIAGEDIHLTKLPVNAEIETEVARTRTLAAAYGVGGTAGSAVETPGDGSTSEGSQLRPTAMVSGEDDATLNEDTGGIA